jgi:xanthine dehydrogenase molybdopterin-binding subunit B
VLTLILRVQATGAAVYVDDMPKVGNEVYGALVLSTRAHAKLLSVDASPALEMEGVVSWVSHTDLPNERANWWGGTALDEVCLCLWTPIIPVYVRFTTRSSSPWTR